MVEIKKITGSQTWPLRFEVMYPNTSIDFVKLTKDDEGTHFGLFYNDELVSVVSLFFKDTVVQFRKLATKESAQRKGFGRKLLNHTFKYCKKKDCTEIWCNARQDKSLFYQKFGMLETDNRFFKNNISYVIMSSKL